MSDYYSDRDGDPEREEPYYEEEALPPLWRRPGVLGALAVLVLAGTAVVVAYHRGVESGAHRVPPLVQAEPGPTKVAPEEPGGMAVPHQDRLIYDRMAGKDAKEPVEQLLPGPEEPVETPKPAESPNLTPVPAPAVGAPTPLAPPAGQATTASGPNTPPQIGPRLSDLLKHTPKQPADATPSPNVPPGTGEGPRVAALEQPAPTTPRGGSGLFFAQLGSVRNDGAANAEWVRLTKRMPDLLGSRGMSLQRADLGAKGVFYRMQTGPFADRSGAQRLCDQVKARGQGCMVVSR